MHISSVQFSCSLCPTLCDPMNRSTPGFPVNHQLPESTQTQSILKEISPGCSLEGLMLKLKLQYFGYLKRRVDSLEKTLMLGGIGAGGEGDDRGWDGWMASLTQWTWVWVTLGVGDGQGGLACCNSWGRKESDMTEQLNWTELMIYYYTFHLYESMFFSLLLS